MEKILKEMNIEVVISAVGGDSILDQLVMVEAIKSVPSIKVLIYGNSLAQTMIRVVCEYLVTW